MSINEYIEIGKNKVKNQMPELFDELNDKFFEILGATKLDFMGMDYLKGIEEQYVNENELYQYIFYKYKNFSLEKCSFEEALNTNEYKKHNILLYSYIPEYVREFYAIYIIQD